MANWLCYLYHAIFCLTKKRRHNQLLNIPHLGKEGLIVEHGKAKTKLFLHTLLGTNPYGDTRTCPHEKKVAK